MLKDLRSTTSSLTPMIQYLNSSYHKMSTDSYHDISTSEVEINNHLNQIKNDLQDKLHIDKLQQSQKIITQTVWHLEDAQQAREPQFITEIINQIESGKKSLHGDSKDELSSSFDKAITICKAKIEGINNQINLSISSLRAQNQRRRRFFDLAIGMKRKLPDRHPAKKILVSELYSDSIEENIVEN